MSDEKYANIDKMQKLSGRPFRVLGFSIDTDAGTLDFREEFQTGYEYWVMNKGRGKVEHKVGEWKDGKFYTRPRYQAGAEFTEDNWKNYEFTNEETGRVQNYFKKVFIGCIEFENEEMIPLWSKDDRAEVPTPVNRAWVTMSPNLYNKLEEVLHDKRSNVGDYVVIEYNAANPPMTKYQVKWFEEYTGTDAPAAPATPVNVVLTDAEREALIEIEGVDVTTESLVEYLMTHDSTAGISQERALEVAQASGATGTVVLA